MFFEQYSHEPYIAVARFWWSLKPGGREEKRDRFAEWHERLSGDRRDGTPPGNRSILRWRQLFDRRHRALCLQPTWPPTLVSTFRGIQTSARGLRASPPRKVMCRSAGAHSASSARNERPQIQLCREGSSGAVNPRRVPEGARAIALDRVARQARAQASRLSAQARPPGRRRCCPTILRRRDWTVDRNARRTRRCWRHRQGGAHTIASRTKWRNRGSHCSQGRRPRQRKRQPCAHPTRECRSQSPQQPKKRGQELRYKGRGCGHWPRASGNPSIVRRVESPPACRWLGRSATRGCAKRNQGASVGVCALICDWLGAGYEPVTATTAVASLHSRPPELFLQSPQTASDRNAKRRDCGTRPNLPLDPRRKVSFHLAWDAPFVSLRIGRTGGVLFWYHTDRGIGYALWPLLQYRYRTHRSSGSRHFRVGCGLYRVLMFRWSRVDWHQTRRAQQFGDPAHQSAIVNEAQCYK